MITWKLNAPIAFLVFNRPETTRRVFDAIAAARPSKLLVVADGPRPTHPGDAQKCAVVRAIIDQVDWDCQVLTNYADTNLGLRRRVSSGLDWVFEQVESAIILEDDCLPHPSFFRFCDELLERYCHDERVMTISGTNYQRGQRRTTDSYYFSRYPHIWGWATWRRAWQLYDVRMSTWAKVYNEQWLSDILNDPWAERYWSRQFQRVFTGEVNTWDTQWTYGCWTQGALSIIPNENLVSNIGFGPGATHTLSINEFANMSASPVEFPLRHPVTMIRDARADRVTQQYVYDSIPLWKKIADKMQLIVKSRVRSLLVGIR